ncbi:MAG: DUF2711 family protein [Pyrinomonadaceae bacterium]|nr:DUF2711 family protein [Pyrinomonadaceae bacterium]MBP6214242.1 DUF2711 family protein [Pyrinomonadaceae bacterium]
MNIFTERNFYPSEDTPIKAHYAGIFDSVFLAFIPFFRLDEEHLSKTSFQKVHQITFPQFNSANPDLKLPENINADIYSNDNPDYPTDAEILKYGTPVGWEEVRQGCGFASYVELNKALTTTIGGYRAELKRQDLADRLLEYALRERIFLPEEGKLDVLSKRSILKTFGRLDKGLVIVEDEYLQKKEYIDIRSITDEEFCERISYKDYYIYDNDQDVLFAVDWDDFFFLICSSDSTRDEILPDGDFEGFLCDANTTVYWEYSDAEIQAAIATG